MNLALLNEVQIGPVKDVPPTAWEHIVREEYARTWLTLADAMHTLGDRGRAEHARGIAARFAPWLEATQAR